MSSWSRGITGARCRGHTETSYTPCTIQCGASARGCASLSNLARPAVVWRAVVVIIVVVIHQNSIGRPVRARVYSLVYLFVFPYHAFGARVRVGNKKRKRNNVRVSTRARRRPRSRMKWFSPDRVHRCFLRQSRRTSWKTPSVPNRLGDDPSVRCRPVKRFRGSLF